MLPARIAFRILNFLNRTHKRMIMATNKMMTTTRMLKIKHTAPEQLICLGRFVEDSLACRRDLEPM
jgi:hypothetical protein